MEPRNIVAIEIASSKIKGGVARVDASGALTVLAVEEIKALDNVRYGRILNVQEVSSGINEIIRKLQNNPAVAPQKIVGAVVPVGGRSLASIPTGATLHLPGDIEIVADTVNRLKQEALKDVITHKAIEAVLPKAFYVNNVAVTKPVGNYGQTFRGDFVLLVIGPETRRNLERVKLENIPGERLYPRLRATAIADLVLTDSERQLGCALVDFGAETSTVSVYKDGALCHLSTLPMGSRLITRDLMTGLSITEDRAEEFKTSIGNAAFGETRGSGSPADANTTEVNNFVQARAGEIAANIVHQILQSGFKTSELPAGIILTGGGARLRNFDNVLSAQSKMSVRQASMPPVVEFRSSFDRTPENIDIVALLWAGARSPKVADCLYTPPASQTIKFGPEEDVFTDEPSIMDEPARETPAAAARETVRETVREIYDAPEDPAQDEETIEEEMESTTQRSRGGFSLGKLFRRRKNATEPYDDTLDDDPDDAPRSSRRQPEIEEIEEEIEPGTPVSPVAAVTDDPFDGDDEQPRRASRTKSGRSPFDSFRKGLDELTNRIGDIFSMPEEDEEYDDEPDNNSSNRQ